jgi:hypothetical protein
MYTRADRVFYASAKTCKDVYFFQKKYLIIFIKVRASK